MPASRRSKSTKHGSAKRRRGRRGVLAWDMWGEPLHVYRRITPKPMRGAVDMTPGQLARRLRSVL